jgi:hypothetical protein
MIAISAEIRLVDPKAVSLRVQGVGLPACLCPEHGVFVADGGYGMRPRWHNDTHERTDALKAPQDPYHRERYSHDHGIYSGVFGDMNVRPQGSPQGFRYPHLGLSFILPTGHLSLKKDADSRLKMYHNLIIVLIVVAI